MKITFRSVGCFAFISLIALVLLAQCSSRTASDSSGTSGQYLYVASGTTFAGTGITMSTQSATVTKFTIDGTYVEVIRDYNDALSFTGDTPVGAIDYDEDYLLVAVENATTPAYRRIEKVAKDGSSVATFLMNSAAFTTATSIIKDLVFSADGGLLISKGTASANAAIEKFNASKARILIAANPYVRAPAGSCATAQTNFARIVVGPGGNILAAHAAATANNKVIMVSLNGYTSAADCITAVTGPTVNHIPTSLLYHSGGKLFVAYASSTGPVHDIYSYDVDATTITNGALAYSNVSLVQGVSAMTEGTDGSIFVASAATGFNSVENFTVDSSTGVLTRVGSAPVLSPNLYTRSISAIVAP